MNSRPKPAMQPQSLEERVLWHCIVYTYLYYLLGALYVLAPVVGWVLVSRLARQTGLAKMPPALWVWVAGMLGMQVALMVAHADFQLGLGAMLKSSVGWAKGWALLPVFMIIGWGQVRLALLARAASWLGIQTLCLLPLLLLAWAIHAPMQLYVSPVSVVGGPGPEYFAVELYGISPDSGAPRWRLFAPWAPAIGMVMCVYFVLVMHETNPWLRRLGMAGMLAATVVSGSRLGLIALPIVLGVGWLIANVAQPIVLMAGAPLALLCGVAAQSLMDLQSEFMSRFHGARADSSRVRAMLGRMAVDRWQAEAPWWGHGTVERGPHLVEYMPIGSHHTWFGLLFVKGLAGVFSLAVPMLYSAAVLIRHQRGSRSAATGLQVLLILLLYTFAENLEILAYLFWPGLVAMGIAFREIGALANAPACPAAPTELAVTEGRPTHSAPANTGAAKLHAITITSSSPAAWSNDKEAAPSIVPALAHPTRAAQNFVAPVEVNSKFQPCAQPRWANVPIR